ncbi:MAG: cupin domain-containing protein [Actinomycetota bacterium]|nr:cupin domain-containing protein [Actinomycetota bacterium]
MESHPNIGHRDGAAPFRIDRGELQGERRRLGPLVGTVAIGCSLYRQGPGERAMPVHLHADEEELFYVTAGSGLSWQDGVTHRVGAGDLICHRAGAEAHGLIAGPHGIEALAFGSGSATNMTWLPRAQAWWMGPRWIPADGPDPFSLEAEAGPLALGEPAPAAARPATLVNLAEVQAEAFARRGYAGRETDLGGTAGSVLSGLRHVVLAPQNVSCPPHWHTGEEELFVVLAGSGEVELGPQRFPLRPGSLVARPPGTGVAHALHAGPDGLTYLAYGTRVSNELVHYPRSGKLGLGGGVFVRAESVDYWDGEG